MSYRRRQARDAREKGPARDGLRVGMMLGGAMPDATEGAPDAAAEGTVDSGGGDT